MLHSLLFLLASWPPPPWGSCLRSSLTPAHEVRCCPFSPHLLCTSLRFCTVRNPSHFVYGRRCCLPSPLRSTSPFRLCVPGRGTLRLVTSRPYLSPCSRKSNGRGCSSRSFQVYWVYPSILLSGIRPVARLQLHAAPLAGTLLLGGSSRPRGCHGRILGYALPWYSTTSVDDVNALGSE